MNESDIKERLGAYLDGELDGAERQNLEAELKASPELREELERLQRTSGNLRAHFQGGVKNLVDDQGEAIAVERIVRMSTQELRRTDLGGRRRRSPLMILAILLALAGFAVLVAGPFLKGEPATAELVRDAATQFETGFVELDLSLGALLGDLLMLIPDELQEFTRPSELVNGRLRIGPEGLSHLALGSDEATGTFLVQAGHDGRSAWILRDPAGPIRRVENIGEAADNPTFGAIFALGDRLRWALDEARSNPAAVEMVGQVEDDLKRNLWKVRLGGGRSSQSAIFWFDEEGRLERVSLGPVDCNVNKEAQLSAEDFQLDLILPGLEVEELR